MARAPRTETICSMFASITFLYASNHTSAQGRPGEATQFPKSHRLVRRVNRGAGDRRARPRRKLSTPVAPQSPTWVGCVSTLAPRTLRLESKRRGTTRYIGRSSKACIDEQRLRRVIRPCGKLPLTRPQRRDTLPGARAYATSPGPFFSVAAR